MSAKKGKADKFEKLRNALKGYKGYAGLIFLISGVVNALALTGAFYMLQIYDRALTSQSVPTLVALSALAIGLYLFYGILDVTRSQVLVRLGAQLDHRLAPEAHRITIDMPRYGYSNAEAMERGRDVETLRHFLSSQAPIALFDLPWMPLYLAFIYALHPYLGLAVFGGAIVLAILTLITEVMTRSVGSEIQTAGIERNAIADSNTRNAEVLKAMGFADRAISRYETANSRYVMLHMRANDVGGSFSGVSKVFRMILQSAVLGLGAYLTIQGDLTAGAIIAASVAAARALAPVDMAIGQWKTLVAARRSYNRLAETLAAIDEDHATVQLPPPKKSVHVDKITVAAPNSGTVVLSDVEFELHAGDAVGLIGPSGGGKSTLVKAMTGVWPLVRGSVRLDQAELQQWRATEIGPHIGYVPQDVNLMDGTIAENISRFEADAKGDDIIAAANAAGVHDMIVRMPDGYETPVGSNGTMLSAGQRQRVALARALYQNPFLVVLDEPNSNLDADGDQALTAAIEGVKARGGIVVIVAHRPSALVAVDKIGVIQTGKLVAFGTKDEIIKDQANKKTPQRPTPQPVKREPAATPAAKQSSDPKWKTQAI